MRDFFLFVFSKFNFFNFCIFLLFSAQSLFCCRVPGVLGRTSAAETSWSPPSLLPPAAKEGGQGRSRSLAALTTIWTRSSPERRLLRGKSRTTTRCRATNREPRRGRRTAEPSTEARYSSKRRLHPDGPHRRQSATKRRRKGRFPCRIHCPSWRKTPLTSAP